MLSDASYLYALIVACEAAFWVVLVLGLAARYLLRRERLSRGWPVVRYDLELWLRCIVAWVITLVLLVGLIALVDDAAITQPLEQWFRIAFGSTVLWFVFGPVWSLVFFQRAEAR